MLHVRAWKAEKAASYWESLNDNEATVRDMNGPPYDPFRLMIPSWMLAEDSKINRLTNFEEKTLLTARKGAVLSGEAMAEIRNELGQ
eukprot:7977832-Heterocapsa_arctica.AAC.1